MTGTIISGTHTIGVVLNNATSENPATVDASGVITIGNGIALSADASAAWTLLNQGTIAASLNFGDAVSFAGAGTVTNSGSAALIEGVYGVIIDGAGASVANSGSIHGYLKGVGLTAGGSLTNAAGGTIDGQEGAVNIAGGVGSIGNAGHLGDIFLYAGGTVVNAAGGVIAGSIPVRVSASAGTLVNSGSILASGNYGKFAISMAAGGTVTNEAAATISGYYDGVNLGAAGTVINDGLIDNVKSSTLHARGVYLAGSGSVTNAAGATITAHGALSQQTTQYFSYALVSAVRLNGIGTVTNAGSIAAAGLAGFGGGFTVGEGIVLAAGGNVTNAAGGSVSAAVTAIDLVGSGTVANYGQLVGSGLYGVTLESTGAISNHASATIVGSADGIRDVKAAMTLTNAGSISGTRYYGVRFGDDGTITNDSGGQIVGSTDGILFDGTAALLLNSGLVSGTSKTSGAYLSRGGSVTNSGTGTINGVKDGVFVQSDAGTVVNSATIIGASTYGVRLSNGGTVSNSGVISGGVIGIDLAGATAGTVMDSGMIASGGSIAVQFGTADDRLVVVAGAVFNGIVDGGVGSNAIELAAGGAGSLTGLGTSIVNFDAITFDTGAAWLIAGDSVGLGGTISGFTASDTIDFTGFAATGKNYPGSALTLTGAGAQTLELPGSFNTDSFNIAPDASGGTFITFACFLAGSRILTEKGEIAVEKLRPGDRVIAASGAIAPIVWIGRQHIDCGRHSRLHAVRPVRIAADAFAPGTPNRDLFLSPDHAIFAGGMLIPVRTLINGQTIAQVEASHVTYFHVELPAHDIVLAAGLATESYLDTGNRGVFEPSVPQAGDTQARTR